MQLFIGFDPREILQYEVARCSARYCTSIPVSIKPVVLRTLQESGLYRRPTLRVPGKPALRDLVSGAPMSTEFAISRFFVPLIARQHTGLAAFVDCDVMFRRSVCDLFAAHERGKAVSVVKHEHMPTVSVKMDGQRQLVYPRKNWSSVMVFDLDHPKIAGLTPEFLNTATGLELHSFSWLADDEIGELPPEFNFLAGYSKCADPAIVHWTEGAPCMPGYEDAQFADDFWKMAERALS